jgi:sigma-54-dependent transcriptional regulator
VDLRVVAATHQNLEALEKEALPPGPAVPAERRIHRDPAPPAAAGEVAGLRDCCSPSSRADAADARPSAAVAMDAYAWPGNVRELKHVLERALAFADAGDRASTCPRRSRPRRPSARGPRVGDVRSTVKDFEQDRIVEALRAAEKPYARGRDAGLPRRTLVYKLSKMKLGDE